MIIKCMNFSLSNFTLKFGAIDILTFYCPLFILGLNYILYNAYGYEEVKQIFRAIAVVLFLLGVFLRKINFSYFNILAGIYLLFLGFFGNTLAYNLFLVLLIANTTTSNIKKFIEVSYILNALLVIVILGSLQFDLLNNYTYVSTMGRLRSTLGFNNPNVAALFFTSYMWLYLISRKTINLYNIIFVTGVNLFIYINTDSRTSFVATIIFLIMVLCFRYFSSVFKKLLAIFSIMFVDILFWLNLISIFFIDYFMVLDEMLSYRISSFKNMIEKSEVINYLVGGTTYTVDNFYYMMFFSFGILVYLLLFLYSNIRLYHLMIEEKYVYISFLVSLFLLGLMESSIIRPEIIMVIVFWKLLL